MARGQDVRAVAVEMLKYSEIRKIPNPSRIDQNTQPLQMNFFVCLAMGTVHMTTLTNYGQ